ncbi:telomere-binding protein CDC13 Ecym_6438 [Eremothecium cymbalariae DBVPG|uniref:Telomeric single stranded DNA binding POT1/Cdc13 domain-containing protein n=1 Tax=Eremothecium cymbalariae (strain CBS 270.75 / DBVPG 7215 / KCTC 17166 / NRRL Y-17582) TaxID=931890 RepID=G8JUM9_ERECY|nr:hypothetical protein Ecym_6438 [Eremothecium cymbalariae DBVPG\
MSSNYRYISKPSELLHYYSKEEIITQKVEFISVLTRITFSSSADSLLYLQNFEHGREDKVPYIARLACKNSEQVRLVRMVLQLLFNNFGLDISISDSDPGFDIDNIYYKRLCFVRCKGTLVTNQNKGSILLHEILSIDMNKELSNENVSSRKLSAVDWAVLNQIVDNLVKLDKHINHEFKIKKLLNCTTKFREYLKFRMQRLESAHMHVNPMFGMNKSLYVQESQDEFNSQREEPYFNSIGGGYGGFYMPNSMTNLEDSIVDNDPIEHTDHMASVGCPTLGTSKPTSGVNNMTSNNESQCGMFCPITEILSIHEKRKPGSLPINHDQDNYSTSLSMSTIGEVESSNKKRFLNSATNSAPVTSKRKMRSVNGIKEHPLSTDTLAEVELNTKFSVTCKVAGIRPNIFEEFTSTNNSLLIYLPVDNTFDLSYMDPNKNCIEIYSSDAKFLFEKCDIDASLSHQDAISQLTYILMDSEISVTFKKEKLFFTNYHYTFCWELEDLKLMNHVPSQELSSPSPKVQLPNNSLQEATQIPFQRAITIPINEITSTTTCVTVFAMLICAKISSKSKVHHFSFTDFTSNPNIGCKIDPYLNDYSIRLRENECIYVKAYPEFLVNFDKFTVKYYNRKLVDCYNGRDANLTNFGMVFRLKLDIKTYNNKHNGIVRDVLLVTNTTKFSAVEEILLQKFYARAFERIPQKCFYHNYKRYGISFPIDLLGQNIKSLEPKCTTSTTTTPIQPNMATTPTSSVSAKKTVQSHIPTINQDIISYNIQRIEDVTYFNSTEIYASGNLYLIKAKILSATVDGSKVTMYLTDDAPLRNKMNPNEVLKVEILGKSNMNYFCGDSGKTLEEELEALILKTFNFFLLPAKIKLSPTTSLLTWCPAECSLDDLKSQAQSSDNLIKVENTSSS